MMRQSALIRHDPEASTTDRFLHVARHTLALCTVLLCAGCLPPQTATQESKPTTPPTPPPAAVPAAPTPHLAYQYPDTPPVLDADGLRSFVSRFKYQIVLLHFWGSWSPNSAAEMPELAQLQEQLVDDGFQVISCNLDEPGRWASDTLPALHKARANFPCVVIRPEAKPGIRAWLNPKWSYDLPARFVLDGQGRVIAHYFSGATLASARDQVRRAISGLGSQTEQGRLAAGAVALRAKLINVRTGQSESLAEVVTKPADADRLAAQLVEILAARVDPSRTPRIAVLPFPSSEDRHHAGSFGTKTAKGVVAALTKRGYRDLLAPDDVQRLFDRTDLTPMTVDFDPSVVVGRLPCDYLLLGWLRGSIPPDPPRQSLAAEDRP